jgi:dihydroneopterin aldolase
MDIVYIKDLCIETVIGIYDWEREIRQTVSLDLEMAANITVPARHDCIDDALNYKDVAKRLIDFVTHSDFQLVETLAERAAELVIREFSVPWLRLRVGKPGALRGATDVGVIIERGQRT